MTDILLIPNYIKITCDRDTNNASVQTDTAIPEDWEYNNCPRLWNINSRQKKFDFYLDSGWDIPTKR